jgi:RNA-directed DNA polymerase
MTRYADDWLVLTNADHNSVRAMRDEIAEFLAEHLKLELNMEKTRVTHITNGFDFLGFHLKFRPGNRKRGVKAWLQVIPSRESIHRVRDKVRMLTSHRGSGRFLPDRELFQAINAIVRGWANYYRYVNAKTTLGTLDWWVGGRVFQWMKKQHHLTNKEVLAKYRHRQTTNSLGKPCDRWNLRADGVWLFKAADIPIDKYFPTNAQWTTNPYIEANTEMAEVTEEGPILATRLTVIDQDGAKWRTIHRKVLERDQYTCQECGRKGNLVVHHRKRRRSRGKDSTANLVVLCRDCHKARHHDDNKRETV